MKIHYCDRCASRETKEKRLWTYSFNAVVSPHAGYDDLEVVDEVEYDHVELCYACAKYLAEQNSKFIKQEISTFKGKDL